MSRINTPDELRQLNRVYFVANNIEELKRVLVSIYGEFPIRFSSPLAVEGGKPDIVIVDLADQFSAEDIGDRPYPGAHAVGWLDMEADQGRKVRGSPESPMSLMLIKAEGWAAWVKPEADRSAGLAADAAHPGVSQ